MAFTSISGVQYPTSEGGPGRVRAKFSSAGIYCQASMAVIAECVYNGEMKVIVTFSYSRAFRLDSLRISSDLAGPRGNRLLLHDLCLGRSVTRSVQVAGV